MVASGKTSKRSPPLVSSINGFRVLKGREDSLHPFSLGLAILQTVINRTFFIHEEHEEARSKREENP